MQGCAETIVALCAPMFRANARPVRMAWTKVSRHASVSDPPCLHYLLRHGRSPNVIHHSVTASIAPATRKMTR